jgi:RNA recognition motif-containing protein
VDDNNQRRLYVGNLSWGVNSDQLAEFFSQAGAVSNAQVITDKYSGRSRGFGFVEMENEADAQKAIEMLNGKELDGREIVVNIARAREERTEGQAPRPQGGEVYSSEAGEEEASE